MRDPSRRATSPSTNLGTRQTRNRPLLSGRPGSGLNNSPGDPEDPTASLAVAFHEGPGDTMKESSRRRNAGFCPPSEEGHQDRQTPQCGRPRFNPWVEKIPWRRKWQCTPVLLPGKSHGQRSLVGCSPWGSKELGMAEQLTLSISLSSGMMYESEL